MEPAALEATWTAIGVLVAALFGVSGLVVGIFGLVQANKARSEATRANTIAAEANDISKEANDLVLKANNIIAEQADRETERTDVAWEWRWDRDSKDHVIIQNIGKSLAKDVIAQFFFEDEVEANDYPMDVEGRGEFKLLIPALADRREFAAESERSSVEWATAQRIASSMPIPPGSTAWVRLRVTWVTPKGRPQLHDTGFSDESLLHNAH